MKWNLNKGKKATDIFEVLRKMPEIKIKHAFCSPIIFVCGLCPVMLMENQNNIVYWKFVLWSFLIVTIMSFILLLIASLEKDAEYRHIKMLFVFKEELLFSFIFPTVISVYCALNSIVACVAIVVLCVIFRVIKIWSLERKIKKGTYGYHMDAKVNTALVGVASMAGVLGFYLFVNLKTFESYSLAYNLVIVWLVFIVLLIVFMIEPIVAIRKIHRDKRGINSHFSIVTSWSKQRARKQIENKRGKDK